MKIAVFCVGNRLMLDDGIGPAVYDELVEHYEIPEEVDLYDLGCMTMKLLNKVDEYDFIITVDAVDGTDSEPGTVFRYKPEDIARTQDAMASASRAQARRSLRCAALLGYLCDGICYGMQIENMSPAELVEGLTPKVYERLPFLVETVVAELDRQGYPLTRKEA